MVHGVRAEVSVQQRAKRGVFVCLHVLLTVERVAENADRAGLKSDGRAAVQNG